MANTTSFPGDISVTGNVRLTGNVTPTQSRANILSETALATFPIPLTSFRVFDSLNTLLPGAGATDDLGLVGGTYGTATPSLRTEDLKAAGATNNRARALVQLPWEYIDGNTITLRFKAGMITTVSDGTATLDASIYKLQDDPDDAIGSDLVTTVAATINSTTFANIDFTVTPTGLSGGDILDLQITTAVNDGATATAVIAGITSAKLLCDVR